MLREDSCQYHPAESAGKEKVVGKELKVAGDSEIGNSEW